MALLDLQSMEVPAAEARGGKPGGSRASKQCGGDGPSGFSLALC